MIDARKYSICVRLSDEPETQLFRATVKEFPDVSVYEEDPGEAYKGILEVIDDLQESFKKQGKPFPEPIDAAVIEASGRTTLRMSKTLHCRAADAALADDISLNQWIVEAVAWRLSGSKAAATVIAPNAVSVTCDVGNGTVNLQTNNRILKLASPQPQYVAVD